jgi:hypothetical protein
MRPVDDPGKNPTPYAGGSVARIKSGLLCSLLNSNIAALFMSGRRAGAMRDSMDRVLTRPPHGDEGRETREPRTKKSFNVSSGREVPEAGQGVARRQTGVLKA